jgi:DNA-directed RNA polymerase specialized sigma subunit
MRHFVFFRVTNMKERNVSSSLCNILGGDSMENSYEQRIQNQFGGFCTKVLQNETRTIFNEYAKLRKNEKSISELSNIELETLSTKDRYFEDEHVFNIQGLPIVAVGNSLADAISKLSAIKQTVILLYYFLDMSDREIGERLNFARQNIARYRKKALLELSVYLKKEDLEWGKN